MPQIYLIGTSHLDLNGSRKLEETLFEIEPRILLVEGLEEKSVARNDYYIALKEELQKEKINFQLAEEMLKKQLRLGYESEMAMKYALSKKGEFCYLNDDLPIPVPHEIRKDARKEVTDLIEKGITFEILIRHLNKRQLKLDEELLYLKSIVGTAQERIDADYNISQSKAGTGPRDAQMEFTLREKLIKNFSKKIVTITGF